jgi:hemerythrin-like domain-containing protein
MTSSTPTAQLVAEHDRILCMLDVLDRLAGLATEAAPPLEAMAQAVEWIRRYADALHHGKEEDLLFPRMEAAGLPPNAGPTACMRHEHVQGRLAVAHMGSAVEALRNGKPDAGAAFARAAGTYTSLLRTHIQKENEILFPMAERMLAPDAKAELLKAFEEVEGEAIGQDEVARLVALQESLAAERLGPASA